MPPEARGLRKGEILVLLESQVNTETHKAIHKHFTRKKHSGITFYGDEAAVWLQKYLSERKDDSEKLFVISERAWFSTEVVTLGVPDRFVVIFSRKCPRNILANRISVFTILPSLK